MRVWLVLVGVLVAAPALAQQALLSAVQAERARYPTPMTPTQLGELLNMVAWTHRAEGWGLLAKPAGTTCPVHGRSIACDILVHAPSATHWDVLSDAEGAAVPTFNPVGPIDLARFVTPFDPGGAPPPPQVPPAVDAVLALLVRQTRAEDSDQQERIYTDLKASIADSVAQMTAEVRAAHASLREQIRLADENPTWFKKIVSNRYVQIAAAAIGTWVTNRLMTQAPDAPAATP